MRNQVHFSFCKVVDLLHLSIVISVTSVGRVFRGGAGLLNLERPTDDIAGVCEIDTIEIKCINTT